MNAEFSAAFATLKSVFARHVKNMSVQADTPTEYTLVTKRPSPFPQHKGNPMFFGSVRLGKAYVSFHLMPLYMCKELNGGISPELKKRMQGKTCFNFKTEPEADLVRELKQLTGAGVKRWKERQWM